MSAWAAALRIARREALRAKGRSALVIAMIALPVAALAGSVVAFDSFQLTPMEKLDRQIGSADASVKKVANEPIRQDPDGNFSFGNGGDSEPVTATKEELAALLPPGTKMIIDGPVSLSVRTPAGVGGITGRATDLGDPMMAGRAKLLSGTAPTNAGEAAITQEAAEWLNLGVGGSLVTVRPAGTFTVTGIVEYPADLGPAVTLHSSFADPGNSDTRWLIDTPEPVTWEQVKALNARGIWAISREVTQNPPAGDGDTLGLPAPAEQLALGGLIGAIAIFEIVLLAGPAFAVGARRRNRDLALIAAAGAEPKQVRRIILADGVVLGLAGAVIGLVIGVSAIALGMPLLEDLSRTRAGAFRMFPLALLVIAGTAVGTGLLAAMVPAFIAARQNIVAVLSGRRGIVRSRKRWIVTGAVLGGTGIAIALIGGSTVQEMLVGGGLGLMELGLVLLTPALIGLIARAGRWLPLAPRLALRDMARNRTSAAPAVAAVMAAVAGAVATGTVLWSLEQQWQTTYTPSLPVGNVSITAYNYDPGQPLADLGRARQIAEEVYPGSVIRGTGAPYCGPAESTCDLSLKMPPERRCPYTEAEEITPETRRLARDEPRCVSNGYWSRAYSMGPVIDDGSGLDTLAAIGADDLAKARQFLATGGVITDDPVYVKDGKVTLSINDKTFQAPAMTLDTGPGGVSAVVPPSALAGTGVTARVERLVIKPATPGTAAQEERLRAQLSELGDGISPYTENGPRRDIDVLTLLLAAGALVIAVGAAGIATGLAAADARADLATLGAVGATPGVRRRLTVSSAGLIGGMGALLGTLTGLIIALSLIMTINAFDAEEVIWPVPPAMPFAIPVGNLLIVLTVPLVAMAGTALFTRARLPIERRI